MPATAQPRRRGNPWRKNIMGAVRDKAPLQSRSQIIATSRRFLWHRCQTQNRETLWLVVRAMPGPILAKVARGDVKKRGAAQNHHLARRKVIARRDPFQQL